MKRFIPRLRRKVENEDGTSTVEFVIVVPVFLLLFVSIFELGMAMTRLTMLEFGLDTTMRDLRLSTGTEFTHDDIRDQICENAGFLKDCENRLHVELSLVKRGTTWTMPDREAICIDQSDGAADPVVNFTNGVPNDVMFVRSCFVIEPLFPAFGLGAIVETDGAGNMHLVANSAFSQEPQ